MVDNLRQAGRIQLVEGLFDFLEDVRFLRVYLKIINADAHIHKFSTSPFYFNSDPCSWPSNATLVFVQNEVLRQLPLVNLRWALN